MAAELGIPVLGKMPIDPALSDMVENEKLARQINGLKDLDATTRYELMTRLESMPKHNKVCHGDFLSRLHRMRSTELVLPL